MNLAALHAQICDDIRARQQWLSRQSTWYAMRHDGLRRRNKPWPHAADLHYPLTDTIIERLKPFYFNQLFSTETVAQFIAKDPALVPLARDASSWFDFKLKQETNLEHEALIAIDKMLMSGHVCLKVYWDSAIPTTAGATPDGHQLSTLNYQPTGRLAFDAIEPTHCIVPESTRALQQADRVTLVHHLSRDQYRRDPRFSRKDEPFIARISGRGASDSTGDSALEQNRQVREGLTHADDDTVIVWEIWTQDETGWSVHWISPLVPSEPLRPSQRNPFRHGRLPIVRFDSEIKDKGHYAARGIPEKAGAFEISLCKYWNEKSDYLTLCNRPLFTSSAPIPNAANLRLVPGQIIPGGLTAVQMPPPPVSFDQEMVQTRNIAEYHIGMPDFGLTENGGSQHRTATEVERVSNLLNLSVDLRSRTFRLSLGALLQLAWSTLLQYDRDTRYFVGGELRRLPENALAEDAWRLLPNGSSESWNRQAQFQRALLRKQLFAQSPWINQPELDRSILELDDPRLVQRLFLNTAPPQPETGAPSLPDARPLQHVIADYLKAHARPAEPPDPGAPAAGVPMPPSAASLSSSTLQTEAAV